MSLSPSLRQQIIRAFIKELEAFKFGGYKFNNGSAKELFPGTQREAFDGYLAGVKGGHVEGYYEIPTGVGKTPLLLAVISCYLRATESIPDAPRVLIHEPTDDLVKQTALAFADFLPRLAPEIEADDEQGRQIDWTKSEVGLKHKGAKGDHMIVITTYQGQAADERKKPGAEKTYKPDVFGLVIHDEAHYLTGPKYGPAAVDKFHSAIQLGVTATPEYSEDKTVANKLRHCYYHLPLTSIGKDGQVIKEGAIERGDLCHVRPILIKTKLTGKDRIRLDKAKEFMAHRGGRPLTEKQLEQLYNQAARNKAVIKSYLAGAHPDTQERYLGQTGMIFAGGIQHCTDFITHAENVLNQPAYRDVKKWLCDAGLCLIAPIHSALPKDGVDITIGGKKVKCTADRIKELHRQGKVLLVISDKQLMLGTDFPMDSFGADLVDRFSVPDATQRFGRLLRVNRGNERLGLAPNPDKSSGWHNVIDETTHEMYAGTPHHPIHAIEILRGAEHRPPNRRKGITRFVPQVHEIGEQLGFDFIHNVEVLRSTAKRFKDEKRKPLPEKTDEWLSPRDISKMPGSRRVPVEAAVRAIILGYDEEQLGEQQVKYNGQSIRVQKLQAGSQQPICIRREDWPKVEQAAGVSAGGCLPEKTDEWLSAADVKEILGGNRAPVKAAVKAIIAAYDEERLGEQQLQYNGQSIRVQKRQAGLNKQPICMRREDWPKVEQAAGVIAGGRLPEKTEEWLSPTDSSKLPGGERTPIKAAVKAIVGAYDEDRVGQQRVQYNGQSIRVQKLQSGHTQQPICIYRGDWPRVEKVAGVSAGVRLPEKTDKWLSPGYIRQMPGGQRAPVESAVKTIIAGYDEGRLGEQRVQYNGQSIRVQKLQASSQQPICIYREDWPKVELAVEASTKESLRRKPIEKRDSRGR